MGKSASKSADSGQLHLRVPMETLRLIEAIEEHFVRTIGFRPKPGNVIELAVKALAEKAGLLVNGKRPGSSAG